ncbi:hypothetical protein [Botrimarina colliarenosi]|nr:hypothetical protein [Botrimarina colliarenosi]
MDTLNEQEIETLLLREARQVPLPTGGFNEVTATRHHWLAVEELVRDYGWSLESLGRLVFEDQRATGADFHACFCRVVAYVLADARHVLGETVERPSRLPLLPSGYQPRESAV